jgi:hypothetical protein
MRRSTPQSTGAQNSLSRTCVLAIRTSEEAVLYRAAVFALGGEELGPGNHLGVLLEQGATLAFGHAAPHAELDAVVEGVGAAFQDHRTMPADNGGFALRGASHE